MRRKSRLSEMWWNTSRGTDEESLVRTGSRFIGQAGAQVALLLHPAVVELVSVGAE